VSGKKTTRAKEVKRRRAVAAAETTAPPARSRRAASRACSAAGEETGVPGWYVVKQGDTLWAIAARHYGAGWRYKRIHAANRRRIRSAHWIYPCQRLYLPRGVRRT
jgi:nucleoid-associated protein YgaU